MWLLSGPWCRFISKYCIVFLVIRYYVSETSHMRATSRFILLRQKHTRSSCSLWCEISFRRGTTTCDGWILGYRWPSCVIVRRWPFHAKHHIRHIYFTQEATHECSFSIVSYLYLHILIMITALTLVICLFMRQHLNMRLTVAWRRVSLYCTRYRSNSWGMNI